MPSGSLKRWNTERAERLNQFEAAHKGLNANRGRRYATLQINHAYSVMLSSQFQGYCRDLHSECARNLTSRIEVVGVPPIGLRDVLEAEFLFGRKLDQGNPNPGNLGTDFNRLGINFWASVIAHDPANSGRQTALEELNLWRNAIAHQDFTTKRWNHNAYTFAPYLTLANVKKWRKNCDALANTFDDVMGVYIGTMIGGRPW